MKLCFCAIVLCAFIAQNSVEVFTEENNGTSELINWYTNLVEWSKVSPHVKRKLDEFECQRAEMDLSIEQYCIFMRGTFRFKLGEKESLESLSQALKWGCPKLHLVIECVRKSQESELQSDTYRNAPIEEIENLLKIIPIFENLMKFFCDNNDGELIVQFMTHLDDCDIFRDGNLTKCENNFHLDQLENYPDPTHCSDYLEGQTCATSVLKERCQSQTVAEAFLTGSTEFYKQLKC